MAGKRGNPYHDAKGLFTNSPSGAKHAEQVTKQLRNELRNRKRSADATASKKNWNEAGKIAKALNRQIAKRFHITRNGVLIDTQNPDAGIASNLRMELGQRGMRKR